MEAKFSSRLSTLTRCVFQRLLSSIDFRRDRACFRCTAKGISTREVKIFGREDNVLEL